MRVTYQSSTEAVIRYLGQQTREILRSQEIIATGKRINRPSDDPQGLSRILDTHQILSSHEQYLRNITQAELHLEALETTLAAVDDLIVQAQSIAVHASQDPALMTSLAGDVAQIREQVVDLANTSLGNVHLFAGHESATAPFLMDGTYTGDDGAYRIQTGQMSEIVLQVDGNTVFKDSEDIFAILTDLQTALENGDISQIQNQTAPLSRFQDHLHGIRGGIGGASDRLTTSRNYLERFITNLESNIADLENADLTEAVLELKMQNTVYEAALAAAADLIQPSLIQFLR